MTSPIFFSPIARREYQVVAGFPRGKEMHAMIDYMVRCANPEIEGQTMEYLKIANEDVTKVILEDQTIPELHNRTILGEILKKINSVVLLNICSALEKMQHIPFWILNDEGEGILQASIKRDDYEKDSDDYIKQDNDRKALAAQRIWGLQRNHEMAEAAGRLAEYDYVYGLPPEPTEWDAYEESVMAQKPEKTEAPATMPFNENKMKKYVHSKPALRVMEIYERNRRKGVAVADADEVLIRAIEREKEFTKLPLAQRQILAATLKCMVNMKLAKGDN